MRDERLHLPSQPAYERPDVPDDPSELDGSGLITTFRNINEWFNYAIGVLARAKAELEAAEEAVETAKSQAWVDELNPEMKVHDKRPFVAVAGGVKVARQKRLEASTYKTLVEAIVDGLKHDREVLSREITRREGDPSGARASARLT